MVFEYPVSVEQRVSTIMRKYRVCYNKIGVTHKDSQDLIVTQGKEALLERSVTGLRQWWEVTSSELEKLQVNPEVVIVESATYKESKVVEYQLSFVPEASAFHKSRRPKVAILREEGTNGDREMAAACHTAGLETWDITMSDLLDGRVRTFDDVQGLIFPGGFTFADVFGSAKGWAGPIRFNPRVRKMFDRFYERTDTFSLGVCNGCQLMANIGWLPWKGISEDAQPRFIRNKSGRFESRWVAVKVNQSPSVLMRGMEGSVLGIHIAHGEGRLLFPDPQIAEEVRKQQLVPLVYVDVEGKATETYPYNPNGSPEGWTALCSPDGRHLAMMPHPERCFLTWQWPWIPEEWQGLDSSPWLKIFQNAKVWCLEH